MAPYGYSARRARGCSSLWLLLAAAGLLVGLGIAALLALPRLVSRSPAPGAVLVSARAPLRLTFSRPMDVASVEQALTFDPPTLGTTAWDGNSLIFRPIEAWPLSSTVTVQLAGGRSQAGLPLLGAQAWSFSVGPLRLAYLTGDPPNLYLTPIDGGPEPLAVTAEPYGVYDYALSPDGAQIAYAARRADGGADLRLINTDGTGAADLLLCPGEACVSPAYSPDGLRLAYQRQALVLGLAGAPGLGAAHVYVRTLATGADELMSDNETRFPVWSPDGRLAYLDTGLEAVVVHDLTTGALTFVPNASGQMGAWSPDGVFIVYPELAFPDLPAGETAPGADELTGAFLTYLTRVTVATNARLNLSGDQALVDDGSPAFSPGGGWIAFGRKQVVRGQWTPGRQLWLMRPDGAGAYALTDDPLYNHSAFIWSPDGRWLAYMRFQVSDQTAPAEIWLVSAAAGSAEKPVPVRLVQGYLPEWLP
ncbi:MAG: PD40 domain-containing protein [Anaerolineales bacterium]|nr:PD40 domain-containing protein [Anaerolineales bacterium]